jgi:hypothetical protein
MAQWQYTLKGGWTRNDFSKKGSSMLEENQGTPKLLNAENAQNNATTAKKLPTIKLTSVGRHKFAEDVLRKGIATANAQKPP